MSYVDLTCKKAVTLLTEYMEGALEVQERAALERHLAWCDWCTTYVNQLRQTTETAASLRDDDTERPPAVIEDVLAAFRNSRRS
jgi:anti-sigma factor RsiW